MRTLKTDPRVDPGVREALARVGMDELASSPALTTQAPRTQLLEFAAHAEEGSEAVFAFFMKDLPPVEGVSSETLTAPGPAGDLPLFVSRPTGATEPLPVIYHLHGGGMVVTDASGASYARWREELAATGQIVVGIDFRNGGGKNGSHHFPAGLDDCAVGLKWVHQHLGELGGSHLVVAGDSGGANLALALAIRAKREGFAHMISGVHAQCPYIYGKWADRTPRYPSLAENDGYYMNCDKLQLYAEVYDPGAENLDDVLCWPERATAPDLEGLPPHVISVNECDPLRDEGIAYYRALRAAGVKAVGRINLGLTHIAESTFRTEIPDLYEAAVRDIAAFAKSLH